MTCYDIGVERGNGSEETARHGGMASSHAG